MARAALPIRTNGPPASDSESELLTLSVLLLFLLPNSCPDAAFFQALRAFDLKLAEFKLTGPARRLPALPCFAFES